MILSRRTCLPLSALLVATLAVGCGKKSGGAGAGFDSPDGVWEASKKCADGEKADLGCLARLATPDGQQHIAAGLVFMSGFALMGAKDKDAAKKELDALLAKHGVDQDAAKKKAEAAKKDGRQLDPAEAMKAMMANVKDVPALLDALSAFFEKTTGKKGGGKMSAIPQGKLAELKIEGESASAKGTYKTKDGDETRDIYFAKHEGQWFIDVQKMGNKRPTRAPIKAPKMPKMHAMPKPAAKPAEAAAKPAEAAAKPAEAAAKPAEAAAKPAEAAAKPE
jgi:hypothetical protein